MTTLQHHAVLLLGPYERACAFLPEDCQSESADVHVRTYEKFTIAEARTLREEASSKPVARTKRTFVIKTERVLREAQHALLKLFEDPPASAEFFLILKDDRELLPTLRSRFHIIVVEEGEHETSEARRFLKSSHAERLSEIGKRHAAKDSAWMEALIGELVIEYEKQVRANSENASNAVGNELLTTEAYMRAQGASKKMLLEHLALSLP